MTDANDAGELPDEPTDEEIEKLKKLRKQMIDAGYDDPFPELADDPGPPPPPAKLPQLPTGKTDCPTCGKKGTKIGQFHAYGVLVHKYKCPLNHIWVTRP